LAKLLRQELIFLPLLFVKIIKNQKGHSLLKRKNFKLLRQISPNSDDRRRRYDAESEAMAL